MRFNERKEDSRPATASAIKIKTKSRCGTLTTGSSETLASLNKIGKVVVVYLMTKK
jgi:hypothetical protein